MSSKVGEFNIKSVLNQALGTQKKDTAEVKPPSVSPGSITKIAEVSSNRGADDAVRVTLSTKPDSEPRSVDIREFARQRGKASEVAVRNREIEGSEGPGQNSGRTLSGTYGGGKFQFNGSNLGGEYFRREDGRLGFTIGEDKRFEGVVQDGVTYIKDTKSGKVYAGELSVGNGEFKISNLHEIDPAILEKNAEGE